MKTTILYRPVGEKELALIRESHYRRFPPREPNQPVFYPVLDRRHAEELARKEPAACFVTRFAVRSEFLATYEIYRVGAANALEYRVPANELSAFNDAIVGPIAVVAEFHGKASGSR